MNLNSNKLKTDTLNLSIRSIERNVLPPTIFGLLVMLETCVTIPVTSINHKK